MMNARRLAVIAAALALLPLQSAQAQWWKSVFSNQNNNDYNNMPPGYGGYGQPQYNNGNNGNLNQVSDNMKNVERNADSLLRNIQMKAQMGGMAAANYSPMIMSLNALKDTARQARRSADNNNVSDLSMKLSQLQTVAGNAVTVAHNTGIDGYTTSQLQMMQSMIQQSMMFANQMPYPNPYNPYNPNPYNPNPYNPNPYNPYNPYGPNFYQGMLAATGSGRGQFSLMGQTLGIRQATLNSSDPVKKTATFTMSGGNQAISLTGVITMQTPNSASMSVTGSDRGGATGAISAAINSDGTLGNVNGNGTLNGQPFQISFRGNN